MKKYLLAAGSLLLATFSVVAQQQQGVVTYDRISKVQFSFQGMPGGMEQQMPSTRTDKFELTFGNNQSLWKAAEQENDETNDIRGGEDGGVHVRMVVAGSNDVLFTNFETGKKVEKREMFEKTFIIDDTINKLKWKMTGESKTILGLPCIKATTTKIVTRMMMNMDNGKTERKEFQDTSVVVAWFTTSIPVSAGPAEYQGQLPGLILEMDIKDGTQIFKATGIAEKADLAVIKEPTGKKHLSPEEFKKEREKMMKEMEQNNQGGQRIIRMN
ncbi:MAG: GLPGLI family protein [Chitinophagaceae bacterium]|nr:GLPGLI family protein [Chitinophagaceae bacterium]